MKKTIVVTGACGLIGSHLVDSILTNSDYRIVAIDDLSTGKRDHLRIDKRIDFFKVDISNFETINRIFEKFNPKIVVHSAASYDDPDNWIRDCLVNSSASINLIKISEKIKVDRFIYLQTGLCYGNSKVPVKVGSPLNPGNSSYSISKTVAEYYLNISRLNFVSFRLSNIIGPRNLSGPLPIFYKRLKNDDECVIVDSRRDFVHIKDLIDVLIKAVCLGLGEGIYNFSSGKTTTVLELYNCLVKHMKIKNIKTPKLIKLENNHIHSILLDSEKTKKDFNHFNFKNLDEIVIDSLDYYEKYSVNNELTHLKFN